MSGKVICAACGQDMAKPAEGSASLCKQCDDVWLRSPELDFKTWLRSVQGAMSQIRNARDQLRGRKWKH